MKTRFCSAIQPQLLMMMAAKLSMRSYSTSQNRETLAVPATYLKGNQKEGSDVCSSRWCSVRPKEEKERSRKCIGRQLRFLQH